MPTRCFTPVLGKKIRVTRLDSCGNAPASGTEDAVAVTDGFITLTLSSEVEEGAEIITKKANGHLCVNEMTDPSFKRFTMELEFCGVDPGLLSLLTNAEIYEDWNENAAGITVPEGTIDTKFGFELWTGLSGQACPTGVEEASGYLLLPFSNAGVLGDLEVAGEDAVNFSMTGAFTKGGNGWGRGPYNVLQDDSSDPAPLPTALDPLDHLLLVETGLAPPDGACGLQAMPAA
jgi:hypothetical protein